MEKKGTIDLIEIIYQAWQEYCQKGAKWREHRPKYILMHWKRYEELISLDIDGKYVFYNPEHTHYVIFEMVIQYDNRMEENKMILSRTNLLDLERTIRGCGDAIPLLLGDKKDGK